MNKWINEMSLKESSVYDDFLKNYKIKDILIGEVSNLDTDDYWFSCEIKFENDGVHVVDNGNEILFINKNKIEDIIDVGMGATQFAINVGTGKIISRYPIHIDIAKKYWGNISLKESKISTKKSLNEGFKPPVSITVEQFCKMGVAQYTIELWSEDGHRNFDIFNCLKVDKSPYKYENVIQWQIQDRTNMVLYIDNESLPF